ncbi:angiotensin-converting enzyme-like [Anopheles ziemanni]|uniref:angiotensin-converting enzyme-like n=1 Tax=Anopheles coustani TaxID=139045 RepID=UPI002659F1C3|nr:angiotensin-converting enzyme-like [Anopheles coustani]XP_058177377.1 angiotensin-converting enzyme-like [Anopheles ziemanni]
MALVIVKAFCVIVAVSSVSAAPSEPEVERTEQAAQRYLANLEPEILAHKSKEADLAWDYLSNSNDETLKRRQEGNTQIAQFFKKIAQELRQYDYNSFTDPDLKRRIKKLSYLGYSVLDEDKFKQHFDAVARMEKNFDTAKVCEYQNMLNCNFTLEQEVQERLANSRDPEELKHYWVQWYDVAGKPVRKDFDKYITLIAEAARLNNFTSGAELWLHPYEDDSFEAQVDAAFEQIRPLYEQLHAYVRYKLREQYGSEIVSEKGPIPIHLLGYSHGQKWDNIMDISAPYSGKALFNITEEMVRQGYTVRKMFELGDEFYQSLNMTKLPPTFWEKSIIEKREDANYFCHTSMWDFYRKDDVRISKCTRITKQDLYLVHHELGFIQYYLQYQNQPSVYRDEAMPGFFETFARGSSLSVSSPKYLQKIGLLKNLFNEESKLNQLYQTAVERLVVLPYLYSMEKYRWGIFRGEIKPEEYNCKYWEMRSKYAGVEPPVMRSESDFDFGSIRYISADFVQYLASFVMQFQLHRAACEKAGEYVKGDPEKTLNNCDISQSTVAGNALKEILAMGSSKPWPDVLEMLTGQRKMSTDALLEYFQPLQDWLVKENKALGVNVGWEANLKCEAA